MKIDVFVARKNRLAILIGWVLGAGVLAACNTGGTLPWGSACDDGLVCTTDTWLASGVCSSVVDPGFCLIGKQCWSDGAGNPANTCEICAPGTDAALWSPAAAGTTCDDQTAMTKDDVCDGHGVCAGTGVQCVQASDCQDVPSCGDAACTNNTCRIVLKSGFCRIDGTCVASGTKKTGAPCLLCDPGKATDVWASAAEGTACDDGYVNTVDDQCFAGGACSGTTAACQDDEACDDGKDCTADTCDRATYTCGHELVAGHCLIAGTCALDGALQGATGNASCHRCVAATPDAWKDLVGGEACDDGDAATVFDVCGAGGVCAGTTAGCRTDGACGDGLDCTTDHCNLTTYECEHAVVAGACRIDGACVVDGALEASTGNASCRTCVAATSGAWTVLVGGEACDDGNAATVSDACHEGGACAGQVAGCLDNSACDDGKSCTTDTCNLAIYTCQNVLMDGACWIDGACHLAGETPANNTCEACNPVVNPMQWTLLVEPRACGIAGICSGGACYDPWPPTQPWHLGKTCELPTCDAAMILPFTHSGNWVVTTHTTATDCNELVQTADPRFLVGNVHVGNPHPLNFVGGCDYQPGGTTVQIGTFVSNVEVTCEVASRPMGTTSVETSVVTFQAGGTAGGTVTVDLYDIPEIAEQPGNHCVISMNVGMQRVADCTGAGDCNDGLACTTDTCDVPTGICVHALAADTCLIGGACVAGGAYRGATGDDTCYICKGAVPSQYGWIQIGSGEPCNDGSATTVNDRCLLGGHCVGTPL
jgi:hypothetical protein